MTRAGSSSPDDAPPSSSDVPACSSQALGDVAEYIGTTRAATYLFWPGAVHAWDGYLTTGTYGADVVHDIRVMEAIVSADLSRVDLTRLDWRP